MRSADQVAHRRRWQGCIAALAAASLVAAGCGGDDDEPAADAATGDEVTTVAPSDAATAAADTTAADATDSSTATDDGAAPSGEPIKVGVISSYTGNFGIYGDPMELAMQLSLESGGNAAGDRPIEVVYEDDATDPGVAVQKATKLVEDGVSVVVCCVNAGSTFAVAPVLADAGIPQITPIANPLGLQDNPNSFVAAPSVDYDAERLGTYAAETLGHETAVVLGMDMAYGQAVAGAFTKGFTDAGGEVVETIYPPFGTQDFGSYLAEIPDADVVFGGFAGADGIAFIQQYDQFGLKAKTPLIAHGPLVTELLLQAEGPSSEGITAAFYYSSQLDNAENERFKTALGAANPALPPSHFTAGAWATGSILLSALAAADDANDGDSVREALAASSVETPWGPMTFDAETGYVFGPTFIYTVVQDGDALRHEVQATIE
ncbi:MAG: ABC transporter substrate-binding protein [Acidimicrobiia bacterium]